jgi:hypothetical protein
MLTTNEGRPATERSPSWGYRAFQVLLNVLTVIAAGVLISQYWSRMSGEKAAPPGGPPRGSEVTLPGLNWAANGRTLILALQVSCPYCKQSMSFYRSILQSGAGKFHSVAVLPDVVEDSTAYLARSALSITDIRQANLDSMGITGTPTILIVDRQGKVDASWTGKLSTEREEEVFRKLNIHRTLTPARQSEVTPSQLQGNDADVVSVKRIAAAWRNLPLIDTRTRQEFTALHLKKSINIPIDELEIRLAHEVPSDREILFLCRGRTDCRTPASDGVLSDCSTARFIVSKIPGFSRAQFLSEGLDDFTPTDLELGVSLHASK